MHSLLMFLVFAFLSPPMISVPVGDAVATLHQQGEVSLMTIAPDEPVVLMSVADDPTDDQQSPEPVPVLTTSWTDVRGVTHSVSTPIASQTEAGLRRATALHSQLVGIMQQQYPPKTN